MKPTSTFLLFFGAIFFFKNSTSAQNNSADTSAKYKSVAAGPQYKRSRWHNFYWGKNYRKEWSTPVTLPVFLLNENEGGLTPVKEGGGHQTKSLHLENANGIQYTLRSVDKRLGKVLPKIFLKTWIEGQVNDEVSMSHPFAAVAVTDMAQAAGIYHTNPRFVYLPKQAALGNFNDEFGNNIYLFEERVKGDKDADNLGNFKKYYSTDEVLKKLQEDGDNGIDAFRYIKSRLFDMMLGDWDRHEDQWEWGEQKKDDKKIFVPVPVDRDQVFFKHNGLILDAAIYGSGLRYFQSFKDHITNVNDMNYEERGIDRVFTNQLTKADWINASTQIEESVTDDVIENAVKKLPPEIYKISGKEIIADLKSRRDLLKNYAIKYYLFLSRQVEIIGTKQKDYFSVNRMNDSTTEVNIYNIKDGVKDSTPYFSRIFYTSETKEIRLFGLDGNDIYKTEGDAKKAITLRIIGGYSKDSILADASSGRKAKTYVYDNHDDYIEGDHLKKELSSDASINNYEYRDYKYDNHFSFTRVLYNDEDRIYAGIGYMWKHFAWRKDPFVFKQVINLHYSITQNAISTDYFGVFPNTIGKWNLSVLVNYDFIRWTNFYGLGNETILTTKNLSYNRMRTREFNSALSLYRKAGNNFFRITGSVRSLSIVNDNERFVSKIIAPSDTSLFNWRTFATAYAVYGFSKVNDSITPTSGIRFSVNGSFTQNINNIHQSSWKYGGDIHLYVPLFYKFSLSIAGGAQTITGNPEFYQYPEIGGGQDLRGFQRQRFYGKTSFYNSNEFRLISNVRSYLYNGKAGVFAFVDDGRVWMPGEKSNTLHVGYGGGIILVPFNFVYGEVTYGFSKEDQLIQFRLTLPL